METDELKRKQPTKDKPAKESDKEAQVTAGAVDKVVDYAFNPSREKIREVTVVDRLQGRLFPQLDMLNTLMHYCLEIAYYRQNKEHYKEVFEKAYPIQPDAMDDFIYRSAQWQKSIAGKNLERAIDIALAETEAKAGEEEFGKADDYYKD